MTKRKPFYFMRKRGKGFIRVQKTRGEYPGIKQVWSDASIAVFENRDEFPMIPGNYKFDKSRNTIVPAGKNFPKFSQLTPKRNGYKKAEPVEIAEALCLLRWCEAGKHVIAVRLKCTDSEDLMEAWLSLEYYDYLTSQQYLGLNEWRIKGKKDPILYLSGNDILAVIMPIRQRE